MRWPALLVLLTLALIGCDRQPAASAPAARDGKPRIVALAPAISQIIADAGAGDLLVGRHAFDRWTDQSLAICGDQSGIDYESLLRIHPTHVLLQWGARDLPPRLDRLARDQGWIVKSYSLLSLDEVLKSADEIGQTWHRRPADVPRSRLSPTSSLSPSNRMDQVFARRASIDAARVGRVLLLYGTSPPTALGPHSYHHQMLVNLGATPSIPTGAPFITLDAEDLLRLAPDAIIMIQPRPPGTPPAPRDVAALRVRLKQLAALNIPAIKHDRLALIDDPMALIPGANLVQVASDMADILDRWSR